MSAHLKDARCHLAALRRAVLPVVREVMTGKERRSLYKARKQARRVLPQLVAELLQHPELLPLGHTAEGLRERWSFQLEIGLLLDQARQVVSQLADAGRRADGDVWKTVLGAYVSARRVPGHRAAKRFSGRLRRALANGPRIRRPVKWPVDRVVLTTGSVERA